jgi:hypothetical protein
LRSDNIYIDSFDGDNLARRNVETAIDGASKTTANAISKQLHTQMKHPDVLNEKFPSRRFVLTYSEDRPVL